MYPLLEVALDKSVRYMHKCLSILNIRKILFEQGIIPIMILSTEDRLIVFRYLEFQGPWFWIL